MNNPQKPSKRTALSRLWRPKRILLWAGLAAGGCLGYLFFWPWDEPPPQDADLRQTEKPPHCAPADDAWPLLEKAHAARVVEITIPIPPAKRTPTGPTTQTVAGDSRHSYDLCREAMIWREEIANATLQANAAVFPLMDQALQCRSLAGMPPIDWRELLKLDGLLEVKEIKEQLAGNHREATRLMRQRIHLAHLVYESLEPNNRDYMGEWLDKISSSLSVLLRDPALSDADLEQLAGEMKPWNQTCAIAHHKNIIRAHYRWQSDNILLDPRRAKAWIPRLKSTHIPIPAWSFKPHMACRQLADEYRELLLQADRHQDKFIAPAATVPDSRADRRQFVLQIFRLNGLGEISSKEYKQSIANRYLRLCEWEEDYSALRLFIACNRHERKYGRLPESPAALVPEFLEAVPAIPPDGHPIEYSAAKRLICGHRIELSLAFAPMPVTIPPLESYIDHLPGPEPKSSLVSPFR
jgi:hypothetical protein